MRNSHTLQPSRIEDQGVSEDEKKRLSHDRWDLALKIARTEAKSDISQNSSVKKIRNMWKKYSKYHI